MSEVSAAAHDAGRDVVNIASAFAGAALVLATVVISACTTAPMHRAEDAVPALDRPFAIDGRLSAKRGSDGAAANFAWSHEGGRDRIDFASPLGQVYARIDGNGDRILVEQPGSAARSYADWRSMTIALLGAPVPVDDLAFWIRGAARAGTVASVERDAQGRAFVLRQQAWEIVYTYPDDAPGARPSRLVLKFPDVEPVEVRIVVDRWSDAQATP